MKLGILVKVSLKLPAEFSVKSGWAFTKQSPEWVKEYLIQRHAQYLTLKKVEQHLVLNCFGAPHAWSLYYMTKDLVEIFVCGFTKDGSEQIKADLKQISNTQTIEKLGEDLIFLEQSNKEFWQDLDIDDL